MHFWMPVFFLYFSSIVTIEEVLLLEAVYYLAVVLLELPSGYFSDRLGRRVTLIISTLGWGLAALVFLITDSFWPFVCAQILTAAGMAFQSGTDGSLLYESLKAMGRESEIARHEARAQSVAFSAMAFSALLGGAVAGLDLRLAYVLTVASALGAFTIALLFIEPHHHRASVAAPVNQMRTVIERSRSPILRWILFFSVALVVFEHVPYEFFQPYLGFLFDGQFFVAYEATPLLSGVLLALVMVVAAIASRYAVTAARCFGVGGVFCGALILEVVVISAMSAWVHPAVLILLLVRSVPSAICRPVANAVIHKQLSSDIRATYFSMQSLAGRLAFSATLFVASLSVSDHRSLSVVAMSEVLDGFTLLGLCLSPLVLYGAIRLNKLVRDAG